MKKITKPNVSVVSGDVVPRPDLKLQKMLMNAMYGKEQIAFTMATASLYGKFAKYDGPDLEVDLMTEAYANSRKSRP